MSYVWYMVSGIVSCGLGSLLLIPDMVRTITTQQVLLSREYLFLKTLFVLNSFQYCFSIAYSFGWLCGLFLAISSGIQGLCLVAIVHVKYKEKQYEVDI